MAIINGNRLLQAIQVKYLTPAGTKKITANGVYNVSANDKAIVAVMPAGTVTRVDDDGAASEINIPYEALPHALINKVGGMSYKSDNLLNIANVSSTTFNGITYSVENGVITLNGTNANEVTFIVIPLGISLNGTYTFAPFNNNINNGVMVRLEYNNIVYYSVTLDQVNKCVTETTNTNIESFVIRIAENVTINNLQLKPMLVSGSIAPATYERYFEGLKHTPVTAINSLDISAFLIETLTIPNQVQALSGYGMGVNSNAYNYIDFERKKYVQKVGIVDLGSLNWTRSYNSIGDYYFFIGGSATNAKDMANLITANYIRTSASINYIPDKEMIIYNNIYSEGNIFIHDDSYTDATTFKTAMSGVYLVYELATPVETDISAYIDNNLIEIEGGGLLEFQKQYYKAVPYSITYQMEV